MGNKFMRKMVTLIVAAAMVLTSGVFAFAESSPTKGKITSVSSVGTTNGKYLNVSWKADKKADYYLVKLTGKAAIKVTGTSKRIAVSPGKSYKVTVTPVYSSGKGTAKSVNRWMRSTTITSVKASGSKKMTITWKKASGATKYRVYIYKNGKWTYVTTKTGTKAVVKVAKKGVTYKFRVIPCKGSYYGVRSPIKSGKSK